MTRTRADAKSKEGIAPNDEKRQRDDGSSIDGQKGVVERCQAIDGSDFIVVGGESRGEQRKRNGREDNG